MKAFFNTKDTVSGFGAGTIFCGFLGLVPVAALGCSRGCPGDMAFWRATVHGKLPTDGWVPRRLVWLWLKAVAGTLCVGVEEAV